MNFADLFQKYRLRSEFSTLRSFGDYLSKKGFIFEDSTFSHWQRGNRTPGNRDLLIALIQIFVERKGITSLHEANLLMEAAGQGYLTNKERVNLFSKRNFATVEEPHFSPELLIEPILTEREYDTLLVNIKDRYEIIGNLKYQIKICHEKIYEGYPGIAYKNLGKIAKIIYELKLHKTKNGINLLGKINWIKVRCLSDLTKADNFKYAYQESSQAYLFAKENQAAELGPSYWVKSAIKRLELVTDKSSIKSKDETKECLDLAKLSLKYTSKKRVSEIYNEHLEIAKIALLLDDNKLFDIHIDKAFHYSSLLPSDKKYLEILVYDVSSRGYLKFNKNIEPALKQIQIAKKKINKRYQAISLYLRNTELQALKSSPDPNLQSHIDLLETKLALKTSILENPYQQMRLQNQKLAGL